MEQQQSRLMSLLSVIAYLRNFFREDSFVVQREDGMSLRILKETKESCRFIRWIRAIEQNLEHIHRILLGVYNARREVVEMYSFDARGIGDMRKICLLLQKMEGLGRRARVRIKVYSYVQLQMDGFKRGNAWWEVKGGEEVSMEGVTIYRGGAGICGGETVRDAKENKKCINGSEIKPSKENTINANSTANTNSTNNTDSTIRCTCTINNNDGDMIQCDECQCWLHTVCTGYFSNSDRRIPATYRCLLCAKAFDTAQRRLSIYRRCLHIVYNEDFRNSKYISDRLGITQGFAIKLFAKLKKDRLVAKEGGDFRALKDAAAKNKVKEYFNGKIMECSISIDELELE